MIHFVGAGPGAADLLTVRATRLLAAADVVLYPGTYLDPDVLVHVSPEAELVDTQRLDLDRITEAGWRAPSSSNRQHRDFIVVTDPDRLAELSTVWQGARHIAGAAAAIVLVVPYEAEEHDRLTDQYDLGQATFAMLVAAADLGIGTGHSAVGDQEKARSILGVPPSRVVAYLIGVGYPADRPLQPVRRPNRRPIEDVVHRGRW